MVGLVLLALSAVGLLLAAVQYLVLRAHLRRPTPSPERRPGMSILKPLCGLDDHLLANLASFAHLDYPNYEIVLGVKDERDPAHAIALQARALWPELVRITLQRGAPGLNPKVNQLITLAAAARHEVLVVSDSNVRVAPDYLDQIAAHLDDPAVGLVTHPIAGIGEQRLGAFLDNVYLSAGISPGVIAAKRVGGQDFVVAKSMAIRRSDLEALGGFEVENVSSFRSVRGFLARYARWSVLQRKSVGPVVYALELLLNPVALAFLALLFEPGVNAFYAWALCSCAKASLDCASARAMRNSGIRLRYLPALLVKDLLIGAAWLYGLLISRVSWRGNLLLVLDGTRLAQVGRASAPLEVVA